MTYTDVGNRGRSSSTAAATEPGGRCAVATREAILQAARTRFAHYGYKKTTIDEIAADAGVGKGTVYLYFSGKEEVLLTLVVEVKRAITERMRDIAASPELPPVEKLRRMMQARILAVYDAATSTTHGKELVDTIRPQICQCGRDQYEAQVRLVADLLREGDGSVFDVPDPERTALLFTTAFESFFPPYICSAFPVERTRAELEAGTAEMVDFLVRGLRRSGGDGGS